MSGKSKEIHTSDGCFRFGPFELYPGERRLLRGPRDVTLPPKVFDALLLFVRNAERLVRREQLMDTLWPDADVTDANLTNVIVSLRKLLGRPAIQTVSRFGYRFVMPVVGEPGVHERTYATFLEAKAQVAVRSLESMSRARDLLALCVAEDPGFAAAWAWLGRCARFLYKFQGGSPASLDFGQAALRRALAIDPHLACAHHFYAQLQIDLGRSREAAVQLVQRLVSRGDEPETHAALVQALRLCGLLDESVAAHGRAIALDPAVATSVTHTHFLRGDYRASLETYSGVRYYLDAAAWAALGDGPRAATLLRERLSAGQLSSPMEALARSLQAILEGRRRDAAAIMTAMQTDVEPEGQFYLARHWGMLGDAPKTVALLARTRDAGMTSSTALQCDAAFDRVRHEDAFSEERRRAARRERDIRRELEGVAGSRVERLFSPLGALDRRHPQ